MKDIIRNAQIRYVAILHKSKCEGSKQNFEIQRKKMELKDSEWRPKEYWSSRSFHLKDNLKKGRLDRGLAKNRDRWRAQFMGKTSDLCEHGKRDVTWVEREEREAYRRRNEEVSGGEKWLTAGAAARQSSARQSWSSWIGWELPTASPAQQERVQPKLHKKSRT